LEGANGTYRNGLLRSLTFGEAYMLISVVYASCTDCARGAR